MFGLSPPSYENVIQSEERVTVVRGAKDPVAVMPNVRLGLELRTP